MDFSTAIVTALPVESAAMRAFVDDLGPEPTNGDPNIYYSGTVPSVDPDRPHRVVVALLANDGTRNAAAISTDLLRSFASVRVIVMCGIAGGVPAPAAPERHVRLGDIVTAAEGVVDYDHVYTTNGWDEPRRAVNGLSTTLLRADRDLAAGELAGGEPWRQLIAERVDRLSRDFVRPPESTDVLYVNDVRSVHPDRRRSGHPDGWPKVHRATIGSADRLLRDAVRRDELAARYGLRAVEMEASGIAVAADLHARDWYIVRGVADYCDHHKNNRWHGYAALVAAAYTRALLGRCPPAGGSRIATTGSLAPLVDALLGIDALRDDYQRRAVMASLPARIRTQVPDNVVARLHLIGLVQTCERFPDGRVALVDMLRVSLGEGSPELAAVERVIERHWRRREPA
jgi:nucleoside phosphorylase